MASLAATKPRQLTRKGRVYLPRSGEARQPHVARVFASPGLSNDWALVSPGFPYEALLPVFRRCSVLYSRHLPENSIVFGEELFEELTHEEGQAILIVEVHACAAKE